MSVEELLRTIQAFDLEIFSPLSTKYSKYSTSNYAASSLEFPTIRDIMSQHLQQLNVVDTILDRMRSVVHHLSDKRVQILSSMKMHEGFMSCIRRLPSDILREIFVQCLPDNKYITPNQHTAPLLLTQICRSWREIAFDTPELWRSLSVPKYHVHKEHIHLYHEHWLKNAKLYPLSVEINLAFAIEEELHAAVTIDFLSRYKSRFSEFSIHFYEGRHLRQLLGDLPILAHLTLTGDMRFMEDQIAIVQQQPRLLTLVIESPSFDRSVMSFLNPGWTNLTRLAVLLRYARDYGNSHIFLVLLRTCPNLEQFIFSPLVISDHDNPPPSLTHPKLRILCIRGIHGTSWLLDRLALPNLHQLLVGNPIKRANAAFDGIFMHEQSLLDGSGNRVVDLTFQRSVHANQRDALIRVLDPGWTELTHLRLDISGGTRCCLALLRLCPRLESMVISLNKVDSLTVQRFYPLTHYTLRSLTIGVCSGDIDPLLDKLILPNLCHLDVRQDLENWPHESFKEFLSRSDCPLETLKITAPRISVEERNELASIIPTLIRLDLHGPTAETTSA